MAEAKLEITDELLVAYVDEELDSTQREMVSSALAANPTLRRREEEMRFARDLVREAFPLRSDTPVPAPIQTAAHRLADACARSSSRSRPQYLFQSQWKYAIVTLVLCVTAFATYLIWPGGDDSPAESATALMQIDPDSPLQGVLELSPSAEMVKVPAEHAEMRAVLTFRSKDGRYCREFEVMANSGGTTGIACRDGGDWRAEVMLGSAAAPPSNSNSYTPAAAESDSPAIADVAERLMEGDPLSAQEEARVLASGWQISRRPP